MTHKKTCTHVIKSKGHKRCFTTTRNSKCNIFNAFRTYLQRLRKYTKKKYNKFKLKKKTQSHTHLRIQKTNNNQVKVHINTLCILGLYAKCGIKIVSWGLPSIYVELDVFEICTHTTRNYAPCKGTKFTTILVIIVCMWPSPTPRYPSLLPLAKTWWHRFEFVDVIWCCWKVGEGCENIIDKVSRMPTERWPTCGLPYTTLCDNND